MTSLFQRCVMVCEDDPAMQRIFQFLLRQNGIGKIPTTPRGDTVVDLAVKNRPDLILLDMMLPGKDGLQVLNDLKQNPNTQAIPVVVVSGKESQQQVSQAMDAGAFDYVIKPFEPGELGLRIRAFLESLDNTESASDAGGGAA